MGIYSLLNLAQRGTIAPEVGKRACEMFLYSDRLLSAMRSSVWAVIQRPRPAASNEAKQQCSIAEDTTPLNHLEATRLNTH
jgi:hypothetical protein